MTRGRGPQTAQEASYAKYALGFIIKHGPRRIKLSKSCGMQYFFINYGTYKQITMKSDLNVSSVDTGWLEYIARRALS